MLFPGVPAASCLSLSFARISSFRSVHLGSSRGLHWFSVSVYVCQEWEWSVFTKHADIALNEGLQGGYRVSHIYENI